MTAKTSLKKDGYGVVTDTFTNEFRLHKFYRYAKTFSILKYNFRSIHFFVNQIAMFAYET